MSDQNRDDDFLDFEDEDFLDEDDYSEGAHDDLGDLSDADLTDSLTDEELAAELDDESWDEFDDAPIVDEVAEADNKTATPKAVAENSGNKSFISRNFNTILIATAVVLGGGFFYVKFIGSNAPSDQAALQGQSAQVDASQRAPFGDNESDRHAIDSEEAAIDLDLNTLRRSDNRVPAELPYQKEISSLHDEGLGAQAQALNVDDYASQELDAEDDLFAEGNDGSDFSLDGFVEIPVQSDSRGSLTPMPQSSGSEDLSTEARARAREVTAGAANEVISEDTPAPETVDAVVDATPPAQDIVPAAVPANQAAEIANLVETSSERIEQIEALRAENSQKNSEIQQLNNQNASLQKDLSTTRDETVSLKETVQTLEDKLAALKKKLAEQNENLLAAQKQTQAAATSIAVKKEEAKPVESSAISLVKPSQPAQTTARVEEKPAATPTPVKKVEPAPASQNAPEWVLRSAQPGQAVLADRKTGNVIKVEIGQTIKGLGKISSIGLVNGVWTVQGSTGTVRR
jgi:flagellar motility protein MotE (MotC chaperone)